MFEVNLIAVFIAGSLSLLPSCGPLLLPAFFAYSFSSRTKLLESGFLFALGFSLVFLPFGLGVKYIADLLILDKQLLQNILGAVLVLWGIATLFGFGIPGLRSPKLSFSAGGRFISAFVLGLMFGVTSGACSAPVLGAVLTLSALQGTTPETVLLLMTFSAGLFVPLFILAFIIQKAGAQKLRWIYETGLDISFARVHARIFWSNLLAGGLFIVLGLSFLTGSGLWQVLGVGGIFTRWFYDFNLYLLSW